MIILDIPVTNGIEQKDVKVRVPALRVPTEAEEVTITVSEKEYALRVRNVNHLVEPDNASALIRTTSLLCSDVPATVEKLGERYDVTSHE